MSSTYFLCHFCHEMKQKVLAERPTKAAICFDCAKAVDLTKLPNGISKHPKVKG